MSKFTLSSQSVAQMCQEVEAYLATTAIPSKERIRIVFTLEEALLRYQSQFGQGHTCQLQCGKKWGRTRISLTTPGQGINPFTVEDDGFSTQILKSLLNSTGLEPTWQYTNGNNVVFWVLPKPAPSALFKLLMSIVLAVAFGLVSYLLPETLTGTISTWIVTPVFSTLMGMLVAISGPLIFLSVAWGIYSIGDAATFGRIGKTIIMRFLVLIPILSLVSNGWMLFFYPLSTGASSLSMDAFFYLFQMILDIIPGNIIAPFSEGNPMQIICLSVVMGISLLVMGKKTTMVASFLEQLSFIVQYLMECISALVPVFIFLSIFNMFLTHQFQVMTTAYKPVLCMLVSTLVLMAVYGAWVSVKCKVSVVKLVKKLMPTFIIGLTTDSSSAAFSTNVETCEKGLGIDKKIVNFGLPLGQVVFMPGAAALFFGLALYMAESYEVDITLPWLLMAFIVTALVSIAAPPIPGGAMSCFTLIFTQLGISTDAVALAIVLNVIVGCIATAVNLYCLQCELTLVSDHLGMFDKDILRK